MDALVFPASQLELGPEIARNLFSVVCTVKLCGVRGCAKVRHVAH